MAERRRFTSFLRYFIAAAFLAMGLLLILGSQLAVRASVPGTPPARPSPAALQANPACDDDADDPVDCGGPLNQLAGLLAADNTTAPDPRDSDLGGVAATGVLLISIGGAVVASSGGSLAGVAATGGVATGVAAAGVAATGANGPLTPSGSVAGTSSAGVAAAPGAGALGVVPAVGGGVLPPRLELVQGGLSIFRSMKRVTEDASPDGYSPGDVAQLIGDAAGIAALASVLAPGIGLISLATGGAAAATDVRSPGEIFERMRSSFGRLGYLQGVVDENVSHVDHDLGDLDSAGDGPSTVAEPPGDPAALSAKDLKAARILWAGLADARFDALARAQQELDDLDDRRSNLAHQIDAIGDLLGRIDAAGTVHVPSYLVDTISYGRGWYFAGDSSKMAAALRASFEAARAAGVVHPRRMTGRTPAQPLDETAGPAAMTLAEWAANNRIPDGRVGVLQALAGLERWRGFYDALASSVGAQISTLRVDVDVAVAARRDLAAEVGRRGMQGGAR